MKTKTCFKCGIEKPLSEFYKHKKMADGHLGKCKECTRKDRADHEANNPEAVFKSRLAVCEKHPTKYNAHKVVETAVNAGVIKKPDYCMGCGCPASESRVESHHHDYCKPLEVVWVCARCHRQLDANRRMREGKKRYGRSRGVILVYDGKEICSFDSISDAAKSVGRKPNSISQCLGGKSKSCAGFGWRYKEADDV